MDEGWCGANLHTKSTGLYFYDSLSNEKEPAIGFIAAISNLNVIELPTTGTRVRTVVEVERQVMNVTILRGTCFDNDMKLADQFYLEVSFKLRN